jgi:hypothetical protein
VLDLRIRRTGDALALHHGPVYLDKMFGSALRSNVLTRDDLKGLNEWGTGKRTVGIIMADFPGESLIANIIANNHHVVHDLGK